MRQLRRRVDLLLVLASLLLTIIGGVVAVALPSAISAVVGALGAAIVLLLASIVHRQRSGARLTAAALESAVADVARAIVALDKRTDSIEQSVRLARSIARSGDEVPAWIALGHLIPLSDAALQRGVDPRTLLAFTDRLATLGPKPTVLILADTAIGALAAVGVRHVREDAHVVVLTSTGAGTERLRVLLDGAPAVDLRTGTVSKHSFGRIAGSWFSADDVDGLDGVELVLVAGPSAEQGAAARHAVVAGVLQLSPRATLVVDTPDERFVSRATELWAETAPEGVQVRRRSRWIVEVERT